MLVNIFIALGIAIGINILFFIFGFIFKNDVFTDITYASTFFVTSLIIMIMNGSYGVTSIIMFTLVTLWSIRLGTFLLIRVWKTKIDKRFDKMRNSFWKFGAFWLFQGFTVWLVNMPTIIYMINPGDSFNPISIIFIILALSFLLFETIADLQKYNWNKVNRGKFINRGLWKISRHPNYFGEYSFWLMLFGISILNNYDPINILGIIGPLYIATTLYKISGVPILEKVGFKLFGKDPKYIDYLNKTPCVIPFIGKKGYKQKWKY
ncbi:MAG: DUF1295 domain-containing protein [Mycoplasmatales bacterium]|nr:DUF1295 domain-containing protein [Mycoplasmatales bacterium]